MLKKKMTFLGMLSILIVLTFASFSNPFGYPIETKGGQRIHYPFGKTQNEVRVRTWYSYYIISIDDIKIRNKYHPMYISFGDVFMIPDGKHKFAIKPYFSLGKEDMVYWTGYWKNPRTVEYNLQAGHNYILCFKYGGEYLGEPIFKYIESLGLYKVNRKLMKGDELSRRIWGENVTFEERILDITDRERGPFLAPECYP